ncbi:MAG TPA: dipeptide epimerase [Bacillales bacterium]|nr:dipeptide epimerase [Bacillales bacterium]
MKITGLQCLQESISLTKPFKTALRTVSEIDSVRVRLELENGQTGWGAAAPTLAITGDSLAGIKGAINGPIQNAVMGGEIENLEGLLIAVQKSCVGNTSAKAAVDIALHDLYCSVFQIPLYQLLGGQVNELETDITVGLDDPSVMQNDAIQRVGEGFNVLKIKVGNDEHQDIRRIETIRNVLGPDIRLRLDANQGWTRKQAVRIIQSLEERDLGIELIEQPVSAADIEGLKFVTERVNTPVMADESVFSPHGAFQILKESAVDLLNIKLMKCGGIRNALQIAAIAEAAGVECMIGSMMESRLSVTAAAHVAAAHNSITRYDLDAALWLKTESVKGGIRYEGKTLTLPKSPGLGIYEQPVSN